jgi:hypothetical protein
MTRNLLIIILLAVTLTVVFAPAALLRRALPEEGPVGLTTPSGTIWNGSGDLVVGGRSVGRLAWQIRPVTILQGALGYHLALSGPAQVIEADLALRPGGFTATLDGTADAAWVNEWIGQYDINLSGRFTFESLQIDAPYALIRSAEPSPAPGTATGRLTWSGGPVAYRLTGQDFAGTLPPLEARFGDALEAVVFAVGNPTPLLSAELLANGFARVGMTRLLPKLLNNPWPGAGPDHEVVLEVEEQVL